MRRSWTALAAVLVAAGCSGGGNEGQQQADANAAQQQQQQQQQQQTDPQEQARQKARADAKKEMGELRFTVDKSDRKLTVRRDDKVVRTHDVAIGTSEHETPTGSWEFHRVDINPEWIPPESEWAEDREKKAPGAPDNPMGRARLVFNMPYTIHGTDAKDSLGKKASHGSIRVSNDIVLELAEMLLKAGGTWEGDQWFRRMTEEQRNTEHQVSLEDPVPIEVVE